VSDESAIEILLTGFVEADLSASAARSAPSGASPFPEIRSTTRAGLVLARPTTRPPCAARGSALWTLVPGVFACRLGPRPRRAAAGRARGSCSSSTAESRAQAPPRRIGRGSQDSAQGTRIFGIVHLERNSLGRPASSTSAVCAASRSAPRRVGFYSDRSDEDECALAWKRP